MGFDDWTTLEIPYLLLSYSSPTLLKLYTFLCCQSQKQFDWQSDTAHHDSILNSEKYTQKKIFSGFINPLLRRDFLLFIIEGKKCKQSASLNTQKKINFVFPYGTVAVAVQ